MELAEVTEKLADHGALLARHDERLDNLEEHRRRQNGSLDELRREVKDMREKDMRELRDKFTAILGGLVVSLILLVINLVITYGMRG